VIKGVLCRGGGGFDGRKTEQGQACPQRRKADRADRGAPMIFWWRRQIFPMLGAAIAFPFPQTAANCSVQGGKERKDSFPLEVRF
jgi:hypothetical protein